MSERPKPANLTRQFLGLHQIAEIAEAAVRETESYPSLSAEEIAYEGYQELIDKFNSFDDPDLMVLVPNVVKLRELLGDRQLPDIAGLGAKDLIDGIKISRELMLEGQSNMLRKAAGEVITAAEIQKAIGAPSVDTAPEALVIGTAGHILERTIMARLKKDGVDTGAWVKDQVLWALEDLALLEHAKAHTYGTRDSVLYNYFATPPNKNGGGMGWRKQAIIDTTCEHFQAIESARKCELLENYLESNGDEFEIDISNIPYDQARQLIEHPSAQ